jgi:hypothetical protein
MVYSNSSPLQVQTVQAIKLWENPEGTKCTRATVALINGYRRVTLGKYFRIVNEVEAKKFNLPLNQWIPEKKGKHLCLGPCEILGLQDKFDQILEGLDTAGHVIAHEFRTPTVPGGLGRADQRAASHAASNSADTPFGKCATPICGKKRGRKPKGLQALEEEDCDSAKRQSCSTSAASSDTAE